ncbi:MAG: YggS family pyridoxal phosphate-dependent enzyme [Abditibacteriota bacterium]|nr:YggS family pyridoxal phosphate-dependent enzyme [Abditibacteriota bacterium]
MKQRIEEIKGRIKQAAERAACGEVALIAVSKTKPVESIREAMAAGLTDFGENYAAEAAEKYDVLRDTPFRLHFIGHLQTNKAKLVVPRAALIQSVDSLRIAREIDRLAGACGRECPVLLEVNISGEESKSGFGPEEVTDRAEMIAEAFPHIKVQGLMGMAPFFEDAEKTRPYFARLKKIYDRLPGAFRKYLSMGMSGDYIQAIEEGSNMVRIGTAIFGERAPRR